MLLPAPSKPLTGPLVAWQTVIPWVKKHKTRCKGGFCTFYLFFHLVLIFTYSDLYFLWCYAKIYNFINSKIYIL